ncbi:hypothetical protein LMG7974_01236 [Campylobacter majalis]|uniref:Sensor histidine kinase n=1 Tax=Campylobacter majalis TaxID=2790656 RepID=A0ABN7KC21_9BACT|nr:hypothetical protein [Campylobacter majalis]CAD7288925.1 hypothetical protein LMG7974_01236 [Campylobacter majalis]
MSNSKREFANFIFVSIVAIFVVFVVMLESFYISHQYYVFNQTFQVQKDMFLANRQQFLKDDVKNFELSAKDFILPLKYHKDEDLRQKLAKAVAKNISNIKTKDELKSVNSYQKGYRLYIYDADKTPIIGSRNSSKHINEILP